MLEARTEGGYRLPEWPVATAGRRPPKLDHAVVGPAVARLRLMERLLVGFLDPVEDAIFLTVGLRRLGLPAALQLGRELAPAVAPGGLYAWVRCGDEVVSTSLPVSEEYVEIPMAER
ncbi:hypothetical protein E1261_13950 [Kribbella albertanoniae]|uniref:Uncharacterized protein n=1 Tax=Kribbella albertanoniae TaxID=1266829 RepID=A0A4R4Q504_9ACTN|nr:hypothetical protein E1261_13950 [Kribbella albertanoniae]